MLLSLVASPKNAPSIDCQLEKCPIHWWSVGRMYLMLVVIGKIASYIGGQWEKCKNCGQWEDFTFNWWLLRRRPLTWMVNVNNVPYIGGQWEECNLCWWSLGRFLLTLMVNGKNQWKECVFYWWPVKRMPLTLVVRGKNVPYIDGQWNNCHFYWCQRGKKHLSLVAFGKKVSFLSVVVRMPPLQTALPIIGVMQLLCGHELRFMKATLDKYIATLDGRSISHRSRNPW